jgi:hypothetical protein
VSAALRRTGARVLWICNLEDDGADTSGMSSRAQLCALREHGVRIDVVLHDPRSGLRFEPDPAAAPVAILARRLQGERGVHDRALLRAALREAFQGDAVAGAMARRAAAG